MRLPHQFLYVREAPLPRHETGIEGQNVWLCSGSSLCWRGKVGVQGNCFIGGMNTPTCTMRGRTCSQVWTLSVRGQFASADSAHHAMPPVRHRLLHWRRHRLRRRLRHRLRHRLRRRRQRMTPIGRAIEECRMQFPRPCVAPRIRIVGIATFVDTVEHSLNRIACETAPSERQQRARGPDASHVGPLIRTLTR